MKVNDLNLSHWTSVIGTTLFNLSWLSNLIYDFMMTNPDLTTLCLFKLSYFSMGHPMLQ